MHLIRRFAAPAAISALALIALSGTARSSPGFDFEDLYQKGAVVAKVWAPQDGGYRLLSMKLYTIKDQDGNFLNIIGIVDITPNDITTPYLPKFVSLTESGTADFRLRQGGRRYTLSLSMDMGQHNILLTLEGVKNGTGGALSSSVEELARLRADQAAEQVIWIGGNQFCVQSQGGSHGTLLFYSKEDIDHARTDSPDIRYVKPVAMADVTKVLSDGSTVPVSGHPDLGLINGTYYHLEMNGDGLWQVAPGVGN